MEYEKIFHEVYTHKSMDIIDVVTSYHRKVRTIIESTSNNNFANVYYNNGGGGSIFNAAYASLAFTNKQLICDTASLGRILMKERIDELMAMFGEELGRSSPTPMLERDVHVKLISYLQDLVLDLAIASTEVALAINEDGDHDKIGMELLTKFFAFSESVKFLYSWAAYNTNHIMWNAD